MRPGSRAARRAVALGLGGALLLTGATPPPPTRTAATIDVVRLQVDGCGDAVDTSGVAAMVDADVAVTAAHVVARAGTITATFGARRTDAAVIAIDARRDLALVRLADPSTSGVAVVAPPEPAAPTGRLRAATSSRGDAVTVARADGSIGGATVRRIDRLVISDIWGRGRHGRAGLELSTDTPLGPGDSGAPVLDGDRRLLGVVFAVSTDASATAWATSASEVEAFLDGSRRGSYRCDPRRSRLVDP